MNLSVRWLAFGLLAISLGGCAPDESDSFETSEINEGGKHAGGSTDDGVIEGELRLLLPNEWGWSRRIHEPTLKVCLVIDTKRASLLSPPVDEAEEFAEWSEHVTDAALTWIEPLREGAGDDELTTEIEFLGKADGCKLSASANVAFADATVAIFNDRNTTIAFVDHVHLDDDQSHPYVRIHDHFRTDGVGFEAALHEFGHVFGLADTYILHPNAPNTCDLGGIERPLGVMCSSKLDELQPYDLDALADVQARIAAEEIGDAEDAEDAED